MPKEIVRRTGRKCFADVMVRWSKRGEGPQHRGGDARVDLFMISRDQLGTLIDGSFWFQPNEHSSLYDPEHPQAMTGPVSVDLDREQLNRLIRTLRTARDQAYGRDE